MTEIKRRIPLFDNIKGILIVLVVFTHFLYEYQDISVIKTIVNAVYFFHMPVFVFTSGYLSKSKNARGRNALVKLVVIYLIFNGIILFMIGRNRPNATMPYKSMWYIFALVIWRMTIGFFSHTKKSIWIMTGVTLLIGFWPSINNTFALARIIAFYPYFISGYLMNEQSLYDCINHQGEYRYWRGFLCVSGAAIIWALSYIYLDYSQYQYLMESYKVLGDIPARISMIAVAWLMIVSFLILVPKKNIPLITRFGKHSLSIFLCHYPIVILFRHYYSIQSTESLILISILCTIFISIIFSLDTIARLIGQYTNIMTAFLLGDKPKNIFDKMIIITGLILGLVIIFFSLYSFFRRIS